MIAVILIFGLIWIPATWLSRPASRERLRVFRRAIRPAGLWLETDRTGSRRIAAGPSHAVDRWAIMGTFGIWSAILGTGWLVLGSPLKGGVMLAVAVVLGIPTIRAASRVADAPT